MLMNSRSSEFKKIANGLRCLVEACGLRRPGTLYCCVIYFGLIFRTEAIEKPYNGKIGVDVLLSSPANIGECIAQITSYDEHEEPQSNAPFILLRFQTNAVYFRKAPTEKELSGTNVTPGFEAFGRFDDDAWLIDPSYGTNIVVLISTSEKGEQVRKSVQRHLYSRASVFFNFGLFDCYPGMVQFDGDRMVEFTNAAGPVMSGRVERNGDGSIHTLDFTVSFGPRAVPWKIDYTYSHDTTLPDGFPSELDAYTVDDQSHPKRRYHIKYLSAVLRASTLPVQAFNPPTENNLYHIVEQNGSGTLAQTPFGVTPVPVEKRSAFVRPVIWLFFISSSVIFAVLLIRRMAETTNKQQKEKV